MKKLFFYLFTITLLFLCPVVCEAGNLTVKAVNIGFEGQDPKPGDIALVEPNVNASAYWIEDYSWNIEYSEWQCGSPVKCRVTLRPADGYKFRKDETRVYAMGMNTSIQTKTVTSERITVQLTYWPSTVLPQVDPSTFAYDDHNSFLLRWDPAEVFGQKWKYYEVRIMTSDGTDKQVITRTVTIPKIDLSDAVFNQFYTIAVRAVPGTHAKARYLKSSPWVTMDDYYGQAEDDTPGTFFGSGNKMLLIDEQGNPITGWVKKNDNWYYFDPQNYNRAVADRMAAIDGKQYYFGENAVMQTGWVQADGYWYYFSPVHDGEWGAMQTGWISDRPGDSKLYYMNTGEAADLPYGAMLTDRTTPDGETVDKEGKRVR